MNNLNTGEVYHFKRNYTTPQRFGLVNDLYFSEGKYSYHSKEEQKLYRSWFNLGQNSNRQGLTLDPMFLRLSSYISYIQTLPNYSDWLQTTRQYRIKLICDGNTVTGLSINPVKKRI